MAPRSASQERIAHAATRLLECKSAPAIVAELADHYGISVRQARRYVAAGYEQLISDIEDSGCDRQQLAAQLVHGLQSAMAMGLASDHPSAVVGAARALADIAGLYAGSSNNGQKTHRRSRC
jgi:predicted DNA-binding transcriptional regulator YafY